MRPIELQQIHASPALHKCHANCILPRVMLDNRKSFQKWPPESMLCYAFISNCFSSSVCFHALNHESILASLIPVAVAAASVSASAAAFCALYCLLV